MKIVKIDLLNLLSFKNSCLEESEMHFKDLSGPISKIKHTGKNENLYLATKSWSPLLCYPSLLLFSF